MSKDVAFDSGYSELLSEVYYSVLSPIIEPPVGQNLLPVKINTNY
jgi:hypothetical protein